MVGKACLVKGGSRVRRRAGKGGRGGDVHEGDTYSFREAPSPTSNNISMIDSCLAISSD
jgi:hypothetical protein